MLIAARQPFPLEWGMGFLPTVVHDCSAENYLGIGDFIGGVEIEI